MFYTVPAMLSPDSTLHDNLFPALETDIMQWDWSELFFPDQPTGSAGSGSDEQKQNLTNATSSNNDHQKQVVPIIDERKRRRKISNRDSARRSRMPERNYLEKLSNEVRQLRIQNQELKSQLKSVSDQNHSLRIDNDLVRFEYGILQQQLLDM